MTNKSHDSVEFLSAQVLAQLAIGVLLIDADGRILWANERQQSISGSGAEALKGKSVFEQGPFSQLGLARVVRQVLTDRQPHFHFINHRGNFCRAEILPLQAGDQFTGAAVLFYDRDGEGHPGFTTARSAAAPPSSDSTYLEFEFAEQRALLFLLSHALNTLPYPVGVIDASAHLIYANTAFQNQFGDNDQVLGHSLADLLPNDARGQIEESIASCFHAGSACGRVPLSGLPAEYLFSKLDDRTGISAAAFVLVGGAAGSGSIDGEVFAAKFESLCSFTGRLVHDLRNPLTALICQLDFLRNEDLYEKGGVHKFQKGIDLIQQQVQGIDAVLEQIEPFGSGGMEEFTEALPADILLNARVVAELQRPHNNIHIEADFAEDLPPMTCEPIRLQKSLVEILLNALEAAGENGHVNLACRFDGAENGYQISIRDDGPGIPEEIRHRIFDPYFTTKKKPGSGLGLTIAYANIARQGGQIQVRTAQPHGTEVIVRLPREPKRARGKKTAGRN